MHSLTYKTTCIVPSSLDTYPLFPLSLIQAAHIPHQHHQSPSPSPAVVVEAAAEVEAVLEELDGAPARPTDSTQTPPTRTTTTTAPRDVPMKRAVLLASCSTPAASAATGLERGHGSTVSYSWSSGGLELGVYMLKQDHAVH